ncbi:excinuclease ABC subunit UvrA [Schaalia sp. ZJ1691]|uniref:ATP-binding cassette domain-containing protein n=1 Tax=Schaalia sp. ZJ1691 TaxID=2709404 RepID=UPI001F154F1B|nr:excinuclease ABC subunit UvrA [Schaalia sp. ZJ1691]
MAVAGTISVRGARENNLRGVNVDIPKHALTVVTGLSGSGKSSLIHDTIAAEATRQFNATHSAFVQGLLQTPPSPDVDVLEGITATITVDQEPMGANPRSTVGTATDIDAMLRVLFSRRATPNIGGPKAYSFNVPTVLGAGAIVETKGGRQVKTRKSFHVTGGMCPTCEGRGQVSDINLAALYNENLSLNEGAILVPGYKAGGWAVRQFSESGLIPADIPIKDFTAKQLDLFLYAEPRKVVIADVNITYQGLVSKVRASILSKDTDSLQPHMRVFVEKLATFRTCPDCEGTRLTEGARASLINGVSIADASAMEVRHLAEWVNELDVPEIAPLIARLRAALGAMVRIGLGYLSLNRSTGTLSGGESQRVRLVRHLGSALSDMTYVFDEPTTGLHPHDVHRMNTLLRDLVDAGNTVLVIEHDPATIAIADRVIDMGPGAGPNGGEVIYEGEPGGLLGVDSPTGREMTRGAVVKSEDQLRCARGHVEIRGACAHNLRNVDVDIPLGMLVAVTGVAGSGKSSLIPGCLPSDLAGGVEVVDQSVIKGSSRSHVATWTGMLDPIRQAFAKAHGVKPALFSANSEGACPACRGLGVIVTELGFMETVSTECDLCGGRRFNDEVLEYTLGGKSIADVLEMTAVEAVDFLSGPDVAVVKAATLAADLVSVGLGYVGIGQSLSTLSGGERQRLKLAQHLRGGEGVLVLDEPTTGLHAADVDVLVSLVDRIVDSGRSVIVIEHDMSVVARCDWVIDLGPGAGDEGGRVIFEGRPGDLAAADTVTGRALARALR